MTTKLLKTNEPALSAASGAKQLFVGLDVHKKSWTVSIHTDLFEHKTFSQPPDSGKLVQYIRDRFPGYSVTCAYEAGFSGYRLQRELELAGMSCIVVNPSDIPTTDKENKYKEDKRDSRKIANQLRSGNLQGIFVPGPKQEQLRSLFRQRNNVVKDLRKSKSRIKSLLMYYGRTIPIQYDNNNWSKNFIKWVQEIKAEHPTLSSCLQGMLRQFEFFRKEKLGTELDLRSYVRKEYSKDYYLLRSIPGIGPIVAIAILSELGDIRRFNTIDQLSNCIGLVPSIYSSGEHETQRGITPRSKLLLRSYLIESSWIAVRADSALTDYYRKNAGKIPPNKNIVKVCSKLIARMYHVIKTGEKYQYNKTK